MLGKQKSIPIQHRSKPICIFNKMTKKINVELLLEKKAKIIGWIQKFLLFYFLFWRRVEIDSEIQNSEFYFTVMLYYLFHTYVINSTRLFSTAALY